MSGPCSCSVSFIDSEGLRHSVQVTAESLFEAAALGVHAFRESTLADCQPGPAAVLEVTVNQPMTMHQVPLRKLTSWLSGAGRSPREQSLKHRLRELLGIRDQAG